MAITTWASVSSVALHRGNYTMSTTMVTNDTTQILDLPASGNNILNLRSSSAVETGSVDVLLYPFAGSTSPARTRYSLASDKALDLQGYAGVSLAGIALVGTLTAEQGWFAGG